MTTLARSGTTGAREPDRLRGRGVRLLVAAVGALSLLALPGATAGASSSSGSLAIGGLSRTYRVHAPTSLAPGAHPALVIVLHGYGGSGAQAERAYGFDVLADREGFIVAYPDGIGRGWNDAALGRHADVDDVAFLRALIDDLTIRNAVDPRRVYVAGMSNGGFMAERLACEMPDRIAAIGAVGASRRAACPAARRISVIHVHGLLDPLVRYGGSAGGAIGAYPAIPALVAAWREVDGCRSVSTVRSPGGVQRTLARGCAGGTGVSLVTSASAGHEWPGGRRAATPAAILDTTAELWWFFEAHPRR